MECNDFQNLCKLGIDVSEILLTPLACSSLVNEIIKGILYQRCQLPYPYDWLKALINKRREKKDPEENVTKNIKDFNHFKLVSSVYDKLETVMLEIKNEFSECKTGVKEILIVIGTTPHTANEVFSISFNPVVDGHNERNHVTQLNKYQSKILRKLFLSQDWLDKIDASLTCTNVYFYILKNTESVNTNGSFIATSPLTFSKKVRFVKISFNTNSEIDTNCCDNLVIFDGVNGSSLNINADKNINETEIKVFWYKFKDLLKGFKDQLCKN